MADPRDFLARVAEKVETDAKVSGDPVLASGARAVTDAGTCLGAVTTVIEQAIGQAAFPHYETSEVLTETPFFGFANLEYADIVVAGRKYRLRCEELGR